MDRSNLPADENLPEVVPDSAPQVLPKEAASYYEAQFGEKDPKYPVILDNTPPLAKDPEDTPVTAAAAVPSSVSPNTTVAWETRSPGTLEQGGDASRAPTEPPEEAKEEEKILGLRRKVFFIIVIVLLIVLAAALGGGLGGGLSKKKSGSQEPAEQGDDAE